MLEDEFIEDDYLDEDEGSGSSGNRPFLVAVGALVTVFILAAACTLIFLMSGRNATNNSSQVAAIETQNAEIAVTNLAVTAAIQATETAQAMPSATPLPDNTATPTAVADVAPTNTPVINGVTEGSVGEGDSEAGASGEEGAGTDGGDTEGETTDGISGVIVGGGDGVTTDTDSASGGTTDGSAEGSTGGTTDGAAEGSSGGTDGSAGAGSTPTPITLTDSDASSALPQTGFETWGIALIGLVLVVVFLAARRLRTS